MPSTTKILGSSWGFSKLWNQAISSIPERQLQKRDYIYASELGGSYIDRYLKMNAVKMSNPPNDRSRRKFSAGHIFEWIVGMVLTMTGILKAKQLKGEVQLPKLLKVVGKLDFIAGGNVDWDAAKKEIQTIQKVFALTVSDMPPIIFHAITFIVASMEKEFKRKQLKEVVFECKSISSFMSARIEKTQQPLPGNELQCAHYLIPNKLDEAYLTYICKDDLISHQFSIFNSSKTLKKYREDVEAMTNYYNAGFDSRRPLKFAPPPEPEIFYDDALFKFSTNYKCEYSPYLSMVYKIDTPELYREKWSKTVASWNRTFKRCCKGDKMTDLNKQVMAEAKKVFDWDYYVDKAKKANAFQKEEIETEE